MKKIAFLVLLLASTFGFHSFGQSKNIELEDFILDIPLEDDDLKYTDTSGIDPEYCRVVLNKVVNSYFENRPNRKIAGGMLTVKTEYLRNLKGVAHLIKLNLTGNDEYGITIFKRNGDNIHLTDELEEDEFKKELRKAVRPGDIVRYYYHTEPDYYAQYHVEKYLSETAPVKRCKFILQSEEDLVYLGQGRMGISKTLDTTYEKMNIIEYTGTNLPIVRKEVNMASGVSMAKVIYQLQYNKAKNWAQREYHNYEMEKDLKFRSFMSSSLEDNKLHLKEYAKIGITNEDDVEKKIIKIDKYMKDKYEILNFNFSSILSGSSSINLAFIQKYLGNSYISPKESIAKYIAFIEKAGIEYELMLAENRLLNTVDKEFQSSNFITYLMIYFPDTKKCVSPSNGYLTYGQLPIVVKDNYAVFILKHNFGDIKTAKYVMRKIKSNGVNENKDILNLTLDLNQESNNSSFTKSLKGDMSLSLVNIYDKLRFDDKEDIFSSTCKEIDNRAIPNRESSSVTIEKDSNEFIIAGKFTSKGLVSEKGIAIGALLGKAKKLSDTKKRQSYFGIIPHEKLVNITILLKEGAEVSNLDEFNKSYANEENTLSYQLTAKKEGNKVIINLTETYHNIVYDLTEYPQVKNLHDLANSISDNYLLIK